MKTLFLIIIVIVTVFCFSFNFRNNQPYNNLYTHALAEFKQQETTLRNSIAAANLSLPENIQQIRAGIEAARLKLKNIDFWLRYFEPIAYNRINGPLPVEWENEVFEKFEPPYRREGAGLSLAELFLDDKLLNKDSLLLLITKSIKAINTFEADSITSQLNTFQHFFLANRLFLLNLAAVYTTGFECPDTSHIIPELRSMLAGTKKIYDSYDLSFPQTPLTPAYLDLYDKAVSFVNGQPVDFSEFDHFDFIKEYVNPLFALNQQFINGYQVVSINFNDYTLNNSNQSIFDKSLYTSQSIKGVYSMVDDEKTLSEIRHIGKLLFYDPILSGNNLRSCASCHKSGEYFNDTSQRTSFQFDHRQHLPRNTPTLINAIYNHLLMLDGKHISLQDQGKDVIANPIEMGSDPKEVLKKVLSCKEYKKAFEKFLKLTPEEREISLNHIVSAVTFYYGSFSGFYAPFDDAMNNKVRLADDVRKGFNLFMSKAKCGTCHFVPYFNGVKPPYVSSEFEVLGVPEDSSFAELSIDKGRFLINPAPETLNAFRTGSLRNAQYTKPYMHNGVFSTLDQVIDFYDAGGGLGKKIRVDNQTLPGDSLKLSTAEKSELIAFLHALNEKIIFEDPPGELPPSSNKALNQRKVGGEY
ncbi:MAG: cytochrome c peroxidase [Bacteroidota bacterium]|nr:cytochrome c peroxidase [Bacteroidota bacterium]MDP4251004.1 cytochrome c peroxidase [Bacteroidota bacterium]